MTTPEHDDLEARAKDYVEHLPAETALGNPDPEGGDRSDPKTFEETSPKGSIAVGKDADLVAFAPDEWFAVAELHHRNPVTPYAGRELSGVVRRTWLGGRPADGEPIGRLLRRGA